VDSWTSVIEGRESERADGGRGEGGSPGERAISGRTTHVRVSACNLMISSRNFDDGGSAGTRAGRAETGDRSERERVRERERGGGGRGSATRGAKRETRRNARPEERTSKRARGRELVGAGAFPLANSRPRRTERQRDRARDQHERERKRAWGRETRRGRGRGRTRNKRKDARPGARDGT